MHLNGSLGIAEGGPWQHRQAQVNGGRREGVGGLVEFDGKGLVGVQVTRLGDQAMAQIGVDAPVAPFIGVGQSGAADRCAEPGVVELGGAGL